MHVICIERFVSSLQAWRCLNHELLLLCTHEWQAVLPTLARGRGGGGGEFERIEEVILMQCSPV
jgi:hypothetical protein